MKILSTRRWVALCILAVLAGFCGTASASVIFPIPKTSLKYNGQSLTLKSIDCLAVHSDSANKGKILIVGPSAEYSFLSMILRLNEDGTLDSTFTNRWAAISCKSLAVSPKDGSFAILQDPVTTTQYFVLKMDSTAKNYWYATSPVAMEPDTILRRYLRVLDSGNIQSVVQWTKNDKVHALAMQFLSEGGSNNTLELNKKFGNNGMLEHKTNEDKYLDNPFVILGDGTIVSVGSNYVGVMESWDDQNINKVAGCPGGQGGLPIGYVDTYFTCNNKTYFGNFVYPTSTMGDALLLYGDKIAVTNLNFETKTANVALVEDYGIYFSGLPLGAPLAQLSVKHIAYRTNDGKLLILYKSGTDGKVYQFNTSPIQFPLAYSNSNLSADVFAVVSNPLAIQKFGYDALTDSETNSLVANIATGSSVVSSGAAATDSAGGTPAPAGSAGGSDSAPKPANCAEGQALVEMSSTDLTSTLKCAVISDLDKDGKCPAGQVVTDAQVCAVTTTLSGGAAGGSASAKSPTKESASVSSAASSGPCPSGQSLQPAKKCVALADLSTDPGADGNCAKNQVLYYVNDVKKCAPAAVMEKDATLGKKEEQPAQPESGGGSGCSLIR